MDKKEFTKAMRIYRDHFGWQFYEERCKRKLTAEDVALDTGILPGGWRESKPAVCWT